MATKYTLPEGMKLATFKVDEQDWEAFKVVCDNQGIPASRALVGFIQQTLTAGKVDESLLPKPKSSQNIDIDIDGLEARLLDRLMARLDDRLEAVIGGK